MKYYSYRENKHHGSEHLPIDYYNVDEHHPRYEMIHHWHKEYEIIFVKSGWLELTLDADTLFLSSGDIVLVNPGVIHSAVPKNAKYECVLFGLDIGIKQHLARYEDGKAILASERTIPIFTVQQNPKIKQAAIALKTAMAKRKAGYELDALSAIATIFSEVILAGLSIKSSEQSLKFYERLLPFEKAISYIENNYGSQISLEKLSLIAGMSRKYFSEYFKKVSGKGVTEFLNCYRIERAAEMLALTNAAVTEIALDCGFNDLSYFIKTFKKQKNTKPAKYRKEMRGAQM
ncbi:MAG: helix-turn-helix transcriptional regulator [Clostridia bacterium]|nr:helix-turn-helix transcriptional regulator [Clostridia bacterium]